MKKSMKKIISILLSVVMIASMFSVLPISATAAVFENYAYTQTTNSDGFVNTFISEPFCDDKITDEEAAYNCVMSVIDRIGGSSSTELELDYIQPNENGMTVVSYSQRAGQMLVYGSTVKLIVDKDDNLPDIASSGKSLYGPAKVVCRRLGAFICGRSVSSALANTVYLF